MSATDTGPEDPGQEQGFLSHLIELRQRLVRAALAVLIVFLALSPFMKHIFDLVSAPLMTALPTGTKLIATGVITPFMVPLKVTLFTAFVIALPYVLWQAWAFVAPGLYRHEKRLAAPIIVTSIVMFLLGMAYCYFVVFRFVFTFIAGFAPVSVNVAPDIEAYFGFVLGMFLAFGITFEVPIIVVLLARFGIADVARLKAVRPYVIVGAFILAAIFTPPDVLSQLLLAIPLWLLYELGIQLARVFGKPKSVDEPAAT
jgi:sec-independent protein translocase protein TatC